jgi:hypothetical protein
MRQKGGGVSRRSALLSRRALTAAVSALALATVAAGLGGSPVAGAAAPTPRTALYLVSLAGPGTAGHHGTAATPALRTQLRREQDRLLSRIGSPAPVYRWTTALNGFAVRLTNGQADRLAAYPDVTTVERNAVRRLAGIPASATGGFAGSGHHRGGAGVVVGFVDSGIWPDNPLFSDVPRLGRAPQGFRGTCQAGEGWDAGTCNRKLVGARWFVDGFGRDRVRTSSSLSPRDDDGHGSQMVSIAAGNSAVSVLVHGQRLGSYGGIAPQARIAVYKACWTAPDPADDGCATADLVTAIDRATRDGVDVLNLSVGGPSTFDTVERALLGAAEADVVVVAAAGNHGGRFTAHPAPWVTTVGSTTGVQRHGRVVPASGPALTGAMASPRGVGPARVVVASRAAAPGASRAQARVCAPGSLDASAVRGTVVLCERGRIARVDKSAAVAEADGVGMVLANPRPGSVDADFHSVPTVHLDQEAAVELRHWLAAHPGGKVSLRPAGVSQPPARVTRWSAAGDPTGAALKPDVVAPGVGLLGAVPPTGHDQRWDFVSGTSAATAYTSGAAALLRAQHRWSASVVRSVLATTAAPVGARSVLDAGAGRVRSTPAARPGLVYAVDPHDYRAWLDGWMPVGRLNTPSLMVRDDASVASRTITNVGHRALYYSSSASGFVQHQVTVRPAAVRLDPGESARFTVRVVHLLSGVHPLDDGWITWRGGNGSETRIPVLIAR